MSHTPVVIGVDGGGTKTVAWVAPLALDESAAVLGRGQAGPGNPRSAGFETAQRNIATAIAAAYQDAHLPLAPAAAGCFGLAGAGREEEQRRMEAWATDTRLTDRVRVTGDAEPILAAASPENTGIALICGTGSLAWGRNAVGEVARCGGWGYLLGDEGSAYQIARAALQAAVRSADGRGPQTTLLPAIQHALAAATPEALIDRVYGSAQSREQLAQLASLVFDASPTDATAAQILRQAAAELAQLVYTLARRLRLEGSDFPLACAGSVLLLQPAFRGSMLAHLHDGGLIAPHMSLVREPVAGAVHLARQLAQS